MAKRDNNPLEAPSKEFTVTRLLDTALADVHQVKCRGTCRHRSAEECASQTHLVFPFRGVYLRHVGGDQAVADANHVLFFNRGEGYQVSHPVTGGDTSLVVSLPEELLAELTPASLCSAAGAFSFNQQHLRIDARAQALHVRRELGYVRGVHAALQQLAREEREDREVGAGLRRQVSGRVARGLRAARIDHPDLRALLQLAQILDVVLHERLRLARAGIDTARVRRIDIGEPELRAIPDTVAPRQFRGLHRGPSSQGLAR